MLAFTNFINSFILRLLFLLFITSNQSFKMKTNVSQVLISNIKSFRNLAMFLSDQYPKLTLKQLASEVGMSEKSFSEIKRGKLPQKKLQSLLKSYVEKNFSFTYEQLSSESTRIEAKRLAVNSSSKHTARKVIYPGTFDPVTYGHLDIITRAVDLFDEVVVTVAVNPTKKPLFTTEERVKLLKDSLRDHPKVKVDSFNGLIVEHAKHVGATGIIRGLRQISDFEFEFQMALMNRKLAGDITTIFLMPHERYTYLNSTVIRNLASLHADVSSFVPPNVHEALKKKF